MNKSTLPMARLYDFYYVKIVRTHQPRSNLYACNERQKKRMTTCIRLPSARWEKFFRNVPVFGGDISVKMENRINYEYIKVKTKKNWSERRQN